MAEPTRFPMYALLAITLTTTAIAGCLEGEETDATIDPLGLHGEPIAATEATRELHAMGYADPYMDVEPTGEVREFDFWVAAGSINPNGGRSIGAFSFVPEPDAPVVVPAPEIRVQQGDTVRVKLHLNRGVFGGHTMHWHGLDVPWRSDGVPALTQPLITGEGKEVWTYEFVAKQPGTYWYHCTVEFPAHLDHGMFGALIIEPRDPDHDLPYDREETLIFHERDSRYTAIPGTRSNYGERPRNPVDIVDTTQRQVRQLFDETGHDVAAATGEEAWSVGPRWYYPAFSDRYKPTYDTFMINGKSYPDTDPVEIRTGETVRLRLINAGQLPKSIHLHGHKMLVTHNDGYPLDEPYWADTVSLTSGQRKDVYVQGTNPGIWKLHDHSGASGMGSTNANDYAFPGGQITAVVYEDFEPPEGKPTGKSVTAGELAVFARGGGR